VIAIVETHVEPVAAPPSSSPRDRLNIVHFFPRIRREEGGVVQVVIDLCQSLADQGHTVRLATCDGPDVPAPWRSVGHNPSFALLEKSAAVPGRLSTRGIADFAKLLSGTDALHLHTPWELSNLQLAKIARRADVPYIVSVHGMLDDYCMRQKGLKKRVFLTLGGRQMFARAAAVHFTATAEMRQATRWIPGDYLPVVQACALDLSPYEALPGPAPALKAFPQIAEPRQKILFLSRIHPKKGLELLIEAAALLKEQDHNFDLVIAGPGEDAYISGLKQLAANRNISHVTHFVGMVRGEVKLSLYELADVFVLPTYQENFGLVLPEALACRTPVVTTKGTDIWRELADAGARIVDQEPAAIAAAVGELLANDQMRTELGSRGREYVRNWLAEDKAVAGYEQMYRCAIACAAQKRSGPR
jgi:glycosyltransferase involved in cell wall biosynthesis